MQVLEIAQLRLNEAKQKAELLKLSIERFAREAQEKIKSSQADLKRMNDDSEARAQELMALYGELEQAYNLAMRDITYDPKTGRIMRAPPGALDRA
jgi:ribosome recycling factor